MIINLSWLLECLKDWEACEMGVDEVIELQQMFLREKRIDEIIDCQKCKATGTYRKKECKVCGGVGKVGFHDENL